MWNRIRSLIIKELQIILRDRKTRIIIIVPPILQIFLFAFASTLEVKNITLGILNRDNGTESTLLIESFRNSPSFVRLDFLPDENAMRRYIDTQQGIGAVYIDEDFSRKIRSGEPAAIQLALDGRRTNVAQIVNGYINTIVSTFNRSIMIRRGSGIPQSELVVRNWYIPNLDYLYFTLPCLIANILMIMGIMIPALSVAREREFGTFDQILVSPLSTFEIIVGKTAPSMLIGFFQATAMIATAIWCLDSPMVGSWLMLYTGMTVFILSVIGVGLFISSLCKTQQQAILGAFVFAVPAVLISGYATPIENMPHWLQTLSLANPVRYIMVIVKGVFLKDISWPIAWRSLYPLGIISIVTLGVAGWFFSRKLE
ncbi:MAG: ABC transporter permease [Lentisphaeria bacterium]|nr:ABC transporter permease [Lentisphaeria bacterium]